VKIFFSFVILSSSSILQSYLILPGGNSFFVPVGSQFCSDNIIVEAGASYTTEVSSGTCEGTIITGEGAIALPVELITFTAEIIKKKYVLLSWETATEVNNYGFEIERSTDKINWRKIAFVNGHGNSNSPKQYLYTDYNISLIKNYYCLKQIDADGASAYSKEIEVSIHRFENDSVLEQNFPNSFNPTTTIGFGIPEKANVRISILNILGEEIIILLNEEKEAGYHLINFNASELPSSGYFCRIQTENFVDTKKMILLK
jgi:hypothetical protein